MRPGAPTRRDRAVLAVVSGPAGHLAAALLELGPALASALGRRIRRHVRAVVRR